MSTSPRPPLPPVATREEHDGPGSDAEAGPGDPSRAVEAAAAWLTVQQVIVRRAAHGLKNALNGVALNLEVVRSRSARGGDMAAIAPFAAAAAAQLERVTAIADALLGLARTARTPVDLDALLRQLAVLLGADDHEPRVDLHLPPTGAPADVDGTVARLCVATALLAATHDGGSATCARTDTADILLRIVRKDGDPPALDATLVSLAAQHRVRVDRTPSALELLFPRLTGARTEPPEHPAPPAA